MRRMWDFFQEFDQLRREIDQTFENFGLGTPNGPVFRWSFLPGRSARAYPLLNVTEDEKNVYVDALAPGLNPDSLQLNVANGQLIISGEKPGAGAGKVKAEAWHRNERAAGRFTRSVALPTEIDSAKAQAEYKNGILCVALPKAEAARPKQITVKVQ